MGAAFRRLKLFGRPSCQHETKGDKTMRFMMLVKSAEIKGAPPKELMDAIAKLAEEAVKAGTIRDSGGLSPTGASTRVRLSRGQVTRGDALHGTSQETLAGLGRRDRNSPDLRAGRLRSQSIGVLARTNVREHGVSVRPGLRGRIEDGVMGSHDGYGYTSRHRCSLED